METLQLKVLRKIFRINTTYIDRENNNNNNNNNSRFDRTNPAIEEENTGKKKNKMTPFVETYNKLKRKRACRIISNQIT